MAYERKIWRNKGESGAFPISPNNLNRMEEGIEAAINGLSQLEPALKEYADNNILFFSGSANYNKGEWVNIFKLPEDINYSKYIALFQGSTITNSNNMKVVPFDTDVIIYQESFKYIKVRISSTGLVSYYHSGTSSTVDVNIMLVPVSKQEMIALH